MTIHHLRRSYDLSALDREHLAGDPMNQFRTWFLEASDFDKPEWLEINAMTLSTYEDSTGAVASRIVLLKHFDDHGFTFFSNYDSDKARQMAEHPQAGLLFYWPHVERQVRIEGMVTKTDRTTSEQYFRERPRASQLGAVASRQSQPISDRQTLEAAVAELAAKHGDAPIECPPYWGGFRLSPSRIEFWQGRPDRLHDRFVYTRPVGASDATWKIDRLSP
ncbi:MAG: pyridoxamine 5'-phosphate oxidase [Pirellulales bacterium]